MLSPLRRVLDVKQIRTGRDGLVIKRGDREGLLLPQVAPEQGWDRMTFLQQTCRKAGLPPGAWQDAETDIFSFTALVFAEEAGGSAEARHTTEMSSAALRNPNSGTTQALNSSAPKHDPARSRA